MVAKFIAEKGPVTGLILTLDEGESWVIGRDPNECDIIIEDPKVSRKHFICRKVRDEYVLQNLSETNPVFINEETVLQPHSSDTYVLKESDRVKVGNSWFRFVVEDTQTNTGDDHYDDIFSDYEDDLDRDEDAEDTTEVSEPEDDTDHIEEDKKDDESDTQYDTIFHDTDEMGDGFGDLSEDVIEGGRWILKVLAGPNMGAEFAMAKDKSYVIGKDVASCDILFHDLSVSRNHAKLTINDDDTVVIEDLNSRNGILVDGQLITDAKPLTSQNLVTLGTTTFVVIDREAASETVISPASVEPAAASKKAAAPQVEEVQQEVKKEEGVQIGKLTLSAGNFILTGVIAAIILVIGVAIVTLYTDDKPSYPKHLDASKNIQEVLKEFPDVQYTYNVQTSHLFLLGHVSTSVDKEQLLYNLNSLKLVKKIEDNVVVDEYIWREMNQVLARNMAWRGVSIHSPVPGRFVLTGYLATNEQGAALSDYVTMNFPYVDRLVNHVIIEENLYRQITAYLHNHDLNNIKIDLANGSVTLTGYIDEQQKEVFTETFKMIKKISGVRKLNDYVVITTEKGYSNASDISAHYQVSGYADHGNEGVAVLVNGQILTAGSKLDGMLVMSIQEHEVFLEKNGLKYKITYNR